MLTFYNFPADHWRDVRTTNADGSEGYGFTDLQPGWVVLADDDCVAKPACD